MADDVSIASIENRFGHRAGPRRIHAAIESIYIDSRLLAIIGKAGLIAREEAAHEIHVCIIIQTHAENREALWRILFLQLDEQRKLLATRLAPGGPERDDERLAVVLRQYLVVAGDVNQWQVGCRGFAGFRRGFGGGRLRRSRTRDACRYKREHDYCKQHERLRPFELLCLHVKHSSGLDAGTATLVVHGGTRLPQMEGFSQELGTEFPPQNSGCEAYLCPCWNDDIKIV